jgi:hypothetical protein
MPNVAKALARGSFATSSATLYTVPASTTTVVTNIVITNASTTSGTFDLLLDGVDLFDLVTVAAQTSLVIDLKQVLATTKVIAGFASATTMRYHISGMEIS